MRKTFLRPMRTSGALDNENDAQSGQKIHYGHSNNWFYRHKM